MYYVMSIPEVLVLIFVLGLWMASIFFCYKRYEKINTIERADIPNFNIKNPNQSLETQSCHSLSKINQTNSANNINPSLTCVASINNLNFNHHHMFINRNNSINELNTPNTFVYEKLRTSSIPQQSLYLIDESKFKTSRIEVSYQKIQKYKKNSQQFSLFNPHRNSIQTRPFVSQYKTIMGKSLSRKNLDFEYSEGCLQKSNSEPALKELFSEISKKSKQIEHGNLSLIKSNSIEHEDNKNCKYQNKRSRLNYNNKSFNDNNLLDPHLIPKVIQKSLIDLHKRSMWNLAHNKLPPPPTQVNDKSNGLSFFNKNKSTANSQNNFTHVMTQMKHGNDIKMKVNDNYV